MHAALGKRQIRRDVLDGARAEAMSRVLGVAPDDTLAPFFHQVFFWDVRGREALGRDGHPAVGGDGFIPSLGLPRRMWAGGRLYFHHPLQVGVEAEKESEIVAVTEKVGRSGPLGFVTLRHSLRQGGVLCVEEDQDLVYRAEVQTSGQSPMPVRAPEDCAPEAVEVDPVLLFRYSALTFNGHRIHYDADYARDIEGYAGVVVHGPLLAQMMMLRAARTAPLRRFSFRGRRPLILGESAAICQDDGRLWVRTEVGHLIMEAEAEWQ